MKKSEDWGLLNRQRARGKLWKNAVRHWRTHWAVKLTVIHGAQLELSIHPALLCCLLEVFEGQLVVLETNTQLFNSCFSRRDTLTACHQNKSLLYKTVFLCCLYKTLFQLQVPKSEGEILSICTDPIKRYETRLKKYINKISYHWHTSTIKIGHPQPTLSHRITLEKKSKWICKNDYCMLIFKERVTEFSCEWVSKLKVNKLPSLVYSVILTRSEAFLKYCKAVSLFWGRNSLPSEYIWGTDSHRHKS